MDIATSYPLRNYHIDSMSSRQERQFDKDLKYFVHFLPNEQSTHFVKSVEKVMKRKAVYHANVQLKKKRKLRLNIQGMGIEEMPKFLKQECKLGSQELKNKLKQEFQQTQFNAEDLRLKILKNHENNFNFSNLYKSKL